MTRVTTCEPQVTSKSARRVCMLTHLASSSAIGYTNRVFAVAAVLKRSHFLSHPLPLPARSLHARQQCHSPAVLTGSARMMPLSRVLVFNCCTEVPYGTSLIHRSILSSLSVCVSPNHRAVRCTRRTPIYVRFQSSSAMRCHLAAVQSTRANNQMNK